jgi:hypothetical protein
MGKNKIVISTTTNNNGKIEDVQKGKISDIASLEEISEEYFNK